MKNLFKKEVKAPVVKVTPVIKNEAPVVNTIKVEAKKKTVIDNDAEYDYETRGKKTV